MPGEDGMGIIMERENKKKEYLKRNKKNNPVCHFAFWVVRYKSGFYN